MKKYLCSIWFKDVRHCQLTSWWSWKFWCGFVFLYCIFKNMLHFLNLHAVTCVICLNDVSRCRANIMYFHCVSAHKITHISRIVAPVWCFIFPIVWSIPYALFSAPCPPRPISVLIVAILYLFNCLICLLLGFSARAVCVSWMVFIVVCMFSFAHSKKNESFPSHVHITFCVHRFITTCR